MFGASLLIAAIVLPLLERRALKAGPVDRPGGRKDHARPTPLTGGIAVLLAVAIPAVAGLLLALRGAAIGDVLPDELVVHLPGIRRRAPQLLAVLLGSAVIMLLGHVDDRRGLSPWLRLLVQGACAAGLVAVGLRATLYIESPALQVALTILFVVFTTNAVNFIDNMNGLMAGVVLIGALHLLGLAIATDQLFMAAILVCLAGGLCAFLPRNFPNARVFIGDAGSTALGFLLAALTLAFTFEDGAPSARPFLLPIAVLAVPLLDGVVVVGARLLRGVHPFTAGHDHLSHRLVRSGLTPTRAVLLLWAVQLLAGLPVVLLGGVPIDVLLTVWGTGGIAALVLGWQRTRREATA
ncbi:MAG: undecaprenyl/decaprenyl-phosphate alpha-N-acetylglucosaminyl 1-phosphate transferase [Planctomycetes bacterium]|nr:undecaprenyl/decaprenyl-phosphate alpha-N-acetylglucosaminyl 1-phosphate transferase [Planctomycetota bacterium]